MRMRSLYSVRVVTVLSVLCLLGVLFACSPLAKNAPGEDFGQVQWYVREITKGEIVPVEGPHQHFEVFEQPIPIRVEEDRFRLTFELPDGRTRHVVFLVRRQGPSAIEVSCPLTNLEPNDWCTEDSHHKMHIISHVHVEFRKLFYMYNMGMVMMKGLNVL